MEQVVITDRCSQFGFMKGRDTTEAVTKLFACTNNALSTDKNIHTAYGLTDEISIEAGLRQGDIISPPLYLLFINPLIESELRGILRAITHTGAAHDLTIYSDSFNSVLFCTKEWQYKGRNETSNGKKRGKSKDLQRLVSTPYLNVSCNWDTLTLTCKTVSRRSLGKRTHNKVPTC
ncbi:hypothetical protein PROFUN_01947 [Planoprotostelium fungivorum]|uniref:Reverse transcriptase domain-containing protein n=1 Tax=Planoprotostelium fungivorum TaxID=1890364 RepID=A0A2P6NAZ6_9EUKA|nr:hypothetical protein PROFUN_01947 [Planoprotostelium fungivorum]